MLDGHADHARAARPKGFQRAEETGLLDEHGVACADKYFGREVDALLAAAGNAHLVWIDAQSALPQQTGDRRAQRW